MFIACRRSWKCSRAFRSPAAAFRMHMFVLRKTQAGHPQGEGGERLWNSSAIEIATNPLRDHTSNKSGEFNRIHVPRGNVQPKRHGEMLDPFGRHLVSMTSGRTDHLTCQDAHLQCMEAQWQRAKWEVIYRSQNHRNQIGRKQGGLYQYNIYIYTWSSHELQYSWLFRLYTYTQYRRFCIYRLHAYIYACVGDICSIPLAEWANFDSIELDQKLGVV